MLILLYHIYFCRWFNDFNEENDNRNTIDFVAKRLVVFITNFIVIKNHYNLL